MSVTLPFVRRRASPEGLGVGLLCDGILGGLGALGVFAALSWRRLSDFDLPGHLAVGRLVIDQGRLLRVDALSYTARPVGHVEYVSDVLLYAAFRLGGPLALQVLGACLALALAASLLRGSFRRPAAYAVVGLVLAAAQPWLLVRPATASFVLLAMLMSVLRPKGPGADPRRLYALPLLFALWANTHSFVVLGLGLVLATTLHAAICRVTRGRLGAFAPLDDARELAPLAMVTALCFAATSLNQAGLRLLEAPLRASRDFGHVAEWDTTTLTFLVHEAPLVLVTVVLTLLALAIGRRPTLFELGVIAVALVLARSAVRMVPVALILVAPVLIERLETLASPRRALRAACALSTWVVGPWMVRASPATLGVGFEPAHFSEAAIAFVQSSRPQGHVYNTFSQGGWLDLRLYPEFQTLVDHRQGWVHSPELLARVYASDVDAAALDSLDREFDLEWAYVFAAEGAQLAQPIARSSAWAMVFWDDAAAVYVKAKGPNAGLARKGYHLMRHLSAPAGALASAIRRDEAARLLAVDEEHAWADAPSSPRAAFLAGCAAIARRDRAALERAMTALAQLAPSQPGAGLLARAWDEAEKRVSP